MARIPDSISRRSVNPMLRSDSTMDDSLKLRGWMESSTEDDRVGDLGSALTLMGLLGLLCGRFLLVAYGLCIYELLE